MKKLLLLVMLCSGVCVAQDSLKHYFNRLGVEFGSMIEVDPTGGAEVAPFLNYYERNCDIVTYSFSFRTLCPNARNVYDWTAMSRVLRYADSVGLKVHFNTLFSGRQTAPTWLSSGGFTDSTIKVIIIDYVDSVFNKVISTIHGNKQIKDLVYEAEIVNELIDATPASTTIWYNSFFQQHVPHYWKYALKKASEVAPNVIIGWNENFIERTDGEWNEGPKYLKLIDTLIADSSALYIEKLWWQSHLQSDTNSVYKFARMKEHYFNVKNKLNVPIGVSEFDYMIPRDTANKYLNSRKQSKRMKSYIKQCLDLGIKEFITWGFNDKTSWINTNPVYGPGYAWPCIYDSLDVNTSTFVKKPAYDTILKLLKNYSTTYRAMSHTATNQIMIRVDNTAIADSQDLFLYHFNLNRINNNTFWGSVNTTGSNVQITDTNGNAIARYIDTVDIPNKQGAIDFVSSAYPDRPMYFNIKYGAGITASNDTSIYRIAGCVIDMSFKNGKIVNKTGLFAMDSIYNPSELTWGTNKYGWYLKGNGTSYARNKTSTTRLDMTECTIYSIAKYDTIAYKKLCAVTNSATSNAVAVGMDSIYGAQNYITINSTNTRFYRPEIMLKDGLYHFGSFTVGDGYALLLNDARSTRQAPYTGAWGISGNAGFRLLASSYSTDFFNGSTNAIIVYNTKKTVEHRSTVYNMLMDTAFYDISTYVPANPFRIDSVGVFNGLYFKGRF